MTKIFLRFVCITILLGSESGFAQAPAASAQTAGVWTEANPRAFCEHDLRPEISAYCKDLADLQTAVNKEKKNPSPDLEVTNQSLVNPLSKLNIADKRATVDFITATASRFALNAAIADAIRTAGQQRLDQQLGATPSASGTTSLLSKAGSAELVSLALDAGVLTRSINGTTATLSMNADQLFRLVTGADPTCIVTTQTCKNESWFETRVAGPTTISASMDLAQQSTTTTATSGQASGATPTPVDSVAIPTGAGKLSGITARYEIRNGFDPRSAQFHSAWASQVTSLAANVKIIGDDTDAVSNLLALHPKFAVPEDADPFAQTKDLSAQRSAGFDRTRAVEGVRGLLVGHGH